MYSFLEKAVVQLGKRPQFTALTNIHFEKHDGRLTPQKYDLDADEKYSLLGIDYFFNELPDVLFSRFISHSENFQAAKTTLDNPRLQNIYSGGIVDILPFEDKEPRAIQALKEYFSKYRFIEDAFEIKSSMQLDIRDEAKDANKNLHSLSILQEAFPLVDTSVFGIITFDKGNEYVAQPFYAMQKLGRKEFKHLLLHQK